MSDDVACIEEPDATADMAALLGPLGKAMDSVEAEHGRGATWHLMCGLRWHLAEAVSCVAAYGSDAERAAEAVLAEDRDA
ncbi:MAG: hypothetical protein K2X74_16185 [Acetobacteraceae bacterium]|nr:hypothetical protein [Acetobacteraceae bacterium]